MLKIESSNQCFPWIFWSTIIPVLPAIPPLPMHHRVAALVLLRPSSSCLTLQLFESTIQQVVLHLRWLWRDPFCLHHSPKYSIPQQIQEIRSNNTTNPDKSRCRSNHWVLSDWHRHQSATNRNLHTFSGKQDISEQETNLSFNNPFQSSKFQLIVVRKQKKQNKKTTRIKSK